MLIHVAHSHGNMVDRSQVSAANQYFINQSQEVSACVVSAAKLLFLSEHTNPCITALCSHGGHYLPAVQYRVVTLNTAEQGVAIISVKWSRDSLDVRRSKVIEASNLKYSWCYRQICITYCIMCDVFVYWNSTIVDCITFRNWACWV